jgi:hypothetical protein
MQLIRLSKPRSGAKYSLISYFFADNRGPYLNLAWQASRAIGLVTARVHAFLWFYSRNSYFLRNGVFPAKH